jgi:hypothetical protein
LRILFNDEDLDPNQFTTGIDYFKYDHESNKGRGQIVEKFKEIIKAEKSDDQKMSESFKVQYAILDFNAMMFQRKIDKIYGQEEFTMSSDVKEPYFSKGEMIHLISDMIEQTGNELDK